MVVMLCLYLLIIRNVVDMMTCYFQHILLKCYHFLKIGKFEKKIWLQSDFTAINDLSATINHKNNDMLFPTHSVNILSFSGKKTLIIYS